eukprot:g43490.t1
MLRVVEKMKENTDGIVIVTKVKLNILQSQKYVEFSIPVPFIVSYRVEEPPGLVELQRNEWDPVIKWIENRYNVVIGTSTSILGPNIPKETKQTFEQHLSSYNSWALVGLEYVVHQLKSVVLSLNLIDRNLDVEKAVLLSRLEEQYQ